MKPEMECRATASVLRSGSTLVLPAHAGGLSAAFQIHSQSQVNWFSAASLLCWCAVVYLAVRIKIDAGFFEMLASDPEHAPEQLDQFLNKAGLRKLSKSPSIEDRCKGALTLWRAMVAMVVVQLLLLFVAEGNLFK